MKTCNTCGYLPCICDQIENKTDPEFFVEIIDGYKDFLKDKDEVISMQKEIINDLKKGIADLLKKMPDDIYSDVIEMCEVEE